MRARLRIRRKWNMSQNNVYNKLEQENNEQLPVIY